MDFCLVFVEELNWLNLPIQLPNEVDAVLLHLLIWQCTIYQLLWGRTI
jgi:hypothetical protein